MLRLTRPDWRDDHGAIAVIVALTMVVVLAMAALVIDIGALQARKAQLQEAVDAAALAIAQGCASTPTTTPASCAASVVAASSTTATTLAIDNINDDQVTVATPQFTSSTVKVTATSTQVGFFSRIFGIDSSGLTASAKAQWTQPVTPLPLAYQECALPDASATTKVFLRSDLLKLLEFPAGCNLLEQVDGVLGASWAVGNNCSFDVNLLSYVGGVLSNLLPSECVSKVTSLIGKDVLLPVYGGALGPIVINGVLLGQGYKVEKFAVVRVTGYDFESLNLLGISLGGPKSMPGSPECPTILTLELPLCQGIQGYLTEYLTPDQAAQRLQGVKLIE